LIFVTVGTARDFSRLVKKVDEIAKKINDEIIIQKGNTIYQPKNCRCFDFLPRDKFLSYIKKADVVVTHGGVGSIINSLKFNKPTIVVPRRRKYNEHRNDHQMDIARELEKERKVLVCYDVENLREKIEEAKKNHPISKKEVKEVIRIKKVLQDFIENSRK